MQARLRSDAVSRRILLKQAGLVAAGLTASSAAGFAFPLSWFQQGEEVVPFADIPENFTVRRDGRIVRLDLRELRSWITPSEEFFSVQHYNVPEVEAGPWRLSVSGLAGAPKALALDDLKRLPRLERTLMFECSGNQARGLHGLMGNATWVGASLKDLLREAKPAPAVKEVIFWAADQGEETIRGNKYTQNFARSMSLDDAMSSDAILAYEMNGQPLPAGHGFPVRLVVPGWYGIANVKWLERIELADSRLMNRFMGRDYVTVMGRQVGDRVEWVETSVTRMRVKSVVARVTRGGGRFKVFGVAWSDGTPLKTVEVRLDEGAWQAARLEPQPNPFAWTFWSLDASSLSPGQHTVVSRATDRNGRVQPASLELKKTYWEDNAQFKRTILVS